MLEGARRPPRGQVSGDYIAGCAAALLGCLLLRPCRFGVQAQWSVTSIRKGHKRKQPSRGAAPLLIDQKDLRIAQLEAQVRQLHRSKGLPVIAEKAQVVPLLSPETLPITLPEWTPKRRFGRKTANPERAIFAQAPEDILRKQQNAIALVQDALYLERDPGAGKTAFTPPVNPPRFEQELLVAANGRCFTNCCVAVANSEDWLRARRNVEK